LYEVQVSDVEERTETSVELGSRAAKRAESRMLIDGELVAAATGEEFDNVSPATGLVLGTTSAADAQDMDRAIAAARRVFDESDWSTNRALRKRCLEQLQAAIEADKEDLLPMRSISLPRARASSCWTSAPT
jgi:aldehyde dehydrogenase (NAD+)